MGAEGNEFGGAAARVVEAVFVEVGAGVDGELGGLLPGVIAGRAAGFYGAEFVGAGLAEGWVFAILVGAAEEGGAGFTAETFVLEEMTAAGREGAEGAASGIGTGSGTQAQGLPGKLGFAGGLFGGGVEGEEVFDIAGPHFLHLGEIEVDAAGDGDAWGGGDVGLGDVEEEAAIGEVVDAGLTGRVWGGEDGTQLSDGDFSGSEGAEGEDEDGLVAAFFEGAAALALVFILLDVSSLSVEGHEEGDGGGGVEVVGHAEAELGGVVEEVSPPHFDFDHDFETRGRLGRGGEFAAAVVAEAIVVFIGDGAARGAGSRHGALP